MTERPDGFLTGLARGPAHGPLPLLLLALTAATGVIDAVSILGLGRVFVANMTGNVVFVGFALAGAPGFSLGASLAALVGFLVGAGGGGPLVARLGAHRGRLLWVVASVELVLVVAGVVVAAVGDREPSPAAQVVVAALLAAAMGAQNTAARRLGVPDLTTTVLTLTLTGIAADLRTGARATTARRILAVLSMFLGAVAGTLLVLHTRIVWALVLAAALLAAVALVAALASRRPAPWHTRAG